MLRFILHPSSFILCLLAIIAVGSLALAQPDTLWTREFDNGGDDYTDQVLITSDGGFVIGSSSWNLSNMDFNIIRTDDNGAQLWSRFYGTGGDDWLAAMAPAGSDGWLLAGFTIPPETFRPDAYLVRVNAVGDTLWTRRYGDSLANESAQAILPLANGDFIIAGNQDVTQAGFDDIFLLRLTSGGDTVWARTIQQPTIEDALSICLLNDGNYLIGGTQYSMENPSSEFYFVKTTASGDTLWTRAYGGPGSDVVVAVQPVLSGGAVFAGLTDSFGEGGDLYLAGLTGGGDTLWSHTYGGPNEDHAHALTSTTDGGFLLAGHTDSFGAANGDIYAVKTDSVGQTQWTFMLPRPGYESAESVQKTPDGGFILAGNRIAEGLANIMLIRLSSPQSANPRSESPAEFALHQNYPNPFNSSTGISFELLQSTHVSLDVFNLTGRRVATLVNEYLSSGSHHLSLDAGLWPSGVYIYRFTTPHFTTQRKMLLLR